jgi:hypothetical protein
VPGEHDHCDVAPRSASATSSVVGQRQRTWPAALTLFFMAALIPQQTVRGWAVAG